MIEATLSVWDRNAIPGAKEGRKHRIISAMSRSGEVIDMTEWELFHPGDQRHPEGTIMPFDSALKFLVDPAFVVKNSKGEQIKPVPVGRSDISQHLEPDQVIARFDELHRDALYQRCKMLAGSEEVKPNAAKEVLIAFIMAAAARKVAASNENAELAKHLGTNMEGMDARSLDSIMPPSSFPGSINPQPEQHAGA
jgi:hypothetical protein